MSNWTDLGRQVSESQESPSLGAWEVAVGATQECNPREKEKQRVGA